MAETRFDFGTKYAILDYKIKEIRDNTAYDASFDVDEETFVVTLTLFNEKHESIKTASFELPLSSLITSVELDYNNKKLIFNTISSEPIECDISELINKININIIPITWESLKSLRDNSLLKPGQQYRITDYITTTTQADIQSAEHQFDIIVTADDVDKLNENARACLHEGEVYFANSKLEVWQLKYCLDNDTNRFAWADEDGTGVIYRLIDEFNNDVPYDFKNVQFIRKLTDGVLDLVNGVDTWVYTFNAYNIDDSDILDGSLLNGLYQLDDADIICKNNMIKSDNQENQYGGIIRKQELNNIVFLNRYSVDDSRYFECYSNTFGNSCYSNTFGTNCYSNTFGYNCNSNTFENDCFSNTFGNNCHSNTFGNGCRSNTFGNSCSDNTFGSGCNFNTFGNDCSHNTFGNSCFSNTFDTGFSYNTFGNYCNSNTFGNNCYFLKISENAGEKRYLNIDNGLRGASAVNQLELYDSAIANKTYQINFKRDADGRILMLWADDIGDTDGKYKNNNLDNSWKTIPQEIEGGSF